MIMIGWKILGGVAFAFGAIGVVLPIWPTTIFWIVAAFAFAKSNPKHADWIYRRPHIGAPIQAFVERGRLGLKSKLAALAGMVVSAAGIGFALWQRPVYLAVAWGLLVVAAVFVMSRKPV